jgi:hypothetical protein
MGTTRDAMFCWINHHDDNNNNSPMQMTTMTGGDHPSMATMRHRQAKNNSAATRILRGVLPQYQVRVCLWDKGAPVAPFLPPYRPLSSQQAVVVIDVVVAPSKGALPWLLPFPYLSWCACVVHGRRTGHDHVLRWQGCNHGSDEQVLHPAVLPGHAGHRKGGCYIIRSTSVLI